ncbi:histidine kinase [Saccharibacillus sp. O23]|uniref:sensor histidine kinase n=1 Tax=Saccharibacillus sp. O23 TaxID=2009338 RepID=UPI00211AB5FA|nr:histidine kinase [Saccharibacillus sp. O23]
MKKRGFRSGGELEPPEMPGDADVAHGTDGSYETADSRSRFWGYRKRERKGLRFKLPAASWHSSIFARLVFIYLLFVLPLILLGLYLYQWSYDNASTEIASSTERRLSGYLEELNREVEWMELQQFDIVEDRKLNRLAVLWDTMGQVERRDTLNDMTERLATFKNSSAYIKNVYVHLPTVGKSLSATHGIDEFDGKAFRYFSSSRQGMGPRLSVREGTLNLGAVRLTGKKGELPLFAVQVELDSDRFREALRQLNLYPDNGSFLIEEKTGFAIVDEPEHLFILDAYRSARPSVGEDAARIEANGTRYQVSKRNMESLGLSVATYLPEASVKRPLNKFYQWAWLFAVTSLLAVSAYLYSSYRLIHKPMLLLVNRFKKMEEGVLDIPIAHARKDEFGFLYARFNQMIEKLQSLIDRDFKQRMMMQRAELKQLQSQINPHFLYNSFFILNSLARTGETQRIEDFTNMLGEYFRFITRSGDDHVLLADEVAHSRVYTNIQQLRFSRRMRVEFDELPEAMRELRAPRLIIQPIIENAYEHSLEKMTAPGLLRVSFGMNGEFAEVRVEDNGDLLDESGIEAMRRRLADQSETAETTGMINIHRRLQLTYGSGSGLKLERSDLGGLKATIRIRWQGGEANVPIVDRG